MTAWTREYINNLPDSSFLWIESGGKKDSEGRTEPRFRHLPYKDSSGRIDLPHVRNALARLSQVKGLPHSKMISIRNILQKILKEQKSSYYDSTEHILYVDYFDDSINKNHVKIPKSEFSYIVDKIPGSPFRIEHRLGIDNIKGYFKSAEIVNNHVFAYINVTDKLTRERFSDGTYRIGEAGMSPAFGNDCEVVCSVCSKGYRECKHVGGENYDGKLCYAILVKPNHREGSLTDSPAYSPSSGKVVDIMFKENGKYVDLMFNISKRKRGNLLNTNMGNANMGNTNMGNAKEVGKNGNDKKDESKDKENIERMSELSKKVEKLEKERLKMRRESRKNELLKFTKSETVINSILDRELSEVEFSNEVRNIKLLKEESLVKGSASDIEKNNENEEIKFKTECEKLKNRVLKNSGGKE